MNLRVNLLKEGETRYQGPVSIRFLVRVGGGTIIALVVLVVAIAIQRQVILRHNLKWSQAEWERVGPRYADIKKKQDMLTNYKGLLDELQAWGNTNARWHEMLLVLQQSVPDTVQLTKLEVDSQWIFIKAPPPPAKAGATEPPKEVPPAPARTVNLMIGGRITGELADEVVVRFTKTIHKARGFDALFDTMKLQRLFKDATDNSKAASRMFEIEGTSQARKLQP